MAEAESKAEAGQWLVECRNEKCGHEHLVEHAKIAGLKCPACLGNRLVARTPTRAKAILKKRTLKDALAGTESKPKDTAAAAPAAPKPTA